MIELGIAEASIYGLAKDNTKRPRAQKLADFYVKDEYWPELQASAFRKCAILVRKAGSNVWRLNGQRDERPAIPDLPASLVLVSTE